MLRRALLKLPAALIGAPWPSARAAQLVQRPFVVGQVVSMSTNGGDIGQAMQLGLQIYFAHVNASGGIAGRQILFVTRDDKYVPSETVRQTRELVRAENPHLLTGFRGTANALALMDDHILAESGAPLVGIFSGAVEIRSSPHIYHTRTTFKEELKALARITQDLGQKRVAVFYQDDAFGKSGLKALEEAAVTYGLDLVVKTPYDRTVEKSERSVREAAQMTKAAAPDAVFLIAVADQTYSFIRQLRGGGYTSSIYSLSVASPERAVELLGIKGARGIAFSQVFPYLHSKGSPLVNEYTRLRERYAPGEPASYFSLEGFVNAKVVVESLRNATASGSANPSRAQIHEALRNMEAFDLGKFIIQFSHAGRQGSRFTDLTVLDDRGRLTR